MLIRTGKTRWIGGKPSDEALKNGRPVLVITVENKGGVVREAYRVTVSGGTITLRKPLAGTVYTVKNNGCNCPDSLKGNRCKHLGALANALPEVFYYEEEDEGDSFERHQERSNELAYYMHGYD